ncbi:MAG: argininosuccinate lyase [Nitrospinae bacterium]|nr:argininosuccinate lyase [Nitrospinota bacterium]
MSKAKKAWSGRFTQSTRPVVEKFNASLGFDRRLYRQDIRGSIAHATMLGRQGIIPEKDAKLIAGGLKKIESEIDRGEFRFDEADEDIHMAVERRLKEMIGHVGGRLHTARSRNDQVATGFRLFIRDAIDELAGKIRKLQRALFVQAHANVDTVAPAYTHLQMAQPIRLSHWFLAHFTALDRDVERLYDARKRVNVLPLGSAALAGTNFPIDREWVARELGFDSVSKNSLDAVSDRDFAAEFLFAAAMTGVHLSRFAEELIVFSTSEFGVIDLPDAFCTGSSIMPQKKNPDVPELVRGKTGRLVGHLVTLLVVMKGLPLAYNKDLQEDKEPVFDAFDQLSISLEVLAELTPELKADVKKLAGRAEDGFMTAVDVADRLTIMGTPFRESHEIVGKLVRACIEKGVGFSGMTAKELEAIDPRLSKVKPGDITPQKSADGKDTAGGTARRRIVARLKEIEKEMKKWR